MKLYSITATYTNQNNTRCTSDIVVQATNPAEAIQKVAEIIQTASYQYIPSERVSSISLTNF